MFLIAAVLMFAVSCEREERIPRTPAAIPGFEDIELEDNCIILKFDPSFVKAQTKAGDTERGLNDLNENTINTIDCFFYRTGETDSAPIFRAIGRTVEDAVAVDSTECFVKVYYNDDIAEVLFGSTTGGTCDAFVIANAALNYNGTCSINDLREMMLEYDFSQQEVQPYFTMCSQETAQVTLYTIPHPDYPSDPTKRISTAAGRVPLYRCASKMQLFLKLPESFKSDDNSVYEPCPDQLGGMKVRIHSGSKRTRVYSDYTLASSDYIHFDDRAISTLANEDLVEGKEDFNYSHTPFYSFPMSWSDLDDNASNYIFSIPWRMIKNKNGDTVNGEPERRYYKLSANVIGRKYEYNHFYRTFVYVQSLGDVELDQAETIDNCYYIISNWVHEGVAASAGSEAISGDFIRYNFLVVEPDEVTLNNEATYTFKFKSSADLKNYKVIIDKVEWKKYNTGVAVPKSVSINNSVSSVANRTANNADFIDPNEYSVTYNYSKGEIYFTHQLNDVYEQRDIYLTVTNNDNISQKVTIHQKPAIMVQLNSSEKVGDVFVDGFFARVTDARDVNGNNFVTSYSARYPANGTAQWSGTFWSSSTSALTNTTHYNPGNQTVSGQQYNYGNYGSICTGRENSENPIYTLEINVSAFNSDNHTYTYSDNTSHTSEYRIADPRVKASTVYPGGFTLHPYLTRRANNQYYGQDWDNPGDILITVQESDKQNYIAPSFLVSSTLNGQSDKPDFQNTVKRGAVYQEAGYPAGRWRLPTEAELAFLHARQQDGTIPNLFKTDGTGRYRAASGRYMTVSGQTVTFSNNDNQSVSSRFVYDLWYWGDNQQSTNQYHPNGHIVNYQ